MAKSNFKHLRDSVEASWESIIRGDAYCPLRPSVRQSSFLPPSGGSAVSLAPTLPSSSLSQATFFLRAVPIHSDCR